jgi:hypothetical protein
LAVNVRISMTRSLGLLLSIILAGSAAFVSAAHVLATPVHAADSPRDDRRIALVIGNSTYRSAPLRNPVNDARAIAQALKLFGFEVVHRENLSQKDMKKTVADFGARLADKGVGLFYYAGHGMQVNGRNYMIPVDAEINNESDVDAESVDVDAVLSRMDGAKTRLNIVILDACRDNPYSRSWRSAQRGLAQIQAGPGTLIAYATAPGKVAADGEGANGLYTGELLKVMGSPGLKIEDVFKRTRVAVQQQTLGAQVPWESSSLTTDFFFVPGKPQIDRAVVASPAADSAEIAFWDGIKSSSNSSLFREYLQKYPNGHFRSLALDKAQALDRPIDSKALQREIHQRLRDKGLSLDVDVAADGIVTLTGVVRSADQKSLAVDAARISGVTDVRSRINVQSNWRMQ